MDFNKIKEMGLEYAEKGKNAAMDLAERGKTQAKIVNEQTCTLALCVPTYVLMVFEDIELILVAFVINDEELASL